MKSILLFFQRLFQWIADCISKWIKWFSNPSVSSFTPLGACSGSIIDIEGNNFGALREENVVTIGGVIARVIEASTTKLKVISAFETVTGKIKVKVNTREGESVNDFVVRSYPLPGSGEDGPPVLMEGQGFPLAGDVPPTGTMRVLVCLVNPSDVIPANPANARTAVVNSWTNVSTFYNQVSYNTLTVQVDVMNNWHTLSGAFADYINNTTTDTSDSERDAKNVRVSQLSRLMAESANAAQGAGENFTLGNYQMIACVIFLNGTFIRAWGGSSTTNFRYDDLSINITVTNAINQLWIQESADWGRYAHETGHNIVAAPDGLSANDDFAERTLGEDIYASDLIDSTQASAQRFDMMGDHDNHPMFSAYHMEKTGWYSSSNILDLTWDRNAFSQEYEVVAHGATQDGIANRYHLVKIKVGDGLFYYIEVRQRPAATEYIYDTDIPVPAGDGGVVITKVLTDIVNNNQQMRFISLLHAENVLRLNDTAEDPARTLKITVTSDSVVARPLVCKVKVEWAQVISDDPGGQFDLRMDPWDSHYQTPDIWIDRSPFGSFDQGNDSEGRPKGNGDKPRPREINKFFSRVHNDGAIAVNNVKVTYYAVDPPGVGDNGNWTPIRTETISSISNNSFQDISTNWVPVLGKHTCMKVFVSQQSGEITGGNNFAQENIFDFEAPAASVPQAVYIPIAVRNPVNEPATIHISIRGVKIGYIVQFPNEWLKLGPLEERTLYLTVVPYLDYPIYPQLPRRYHREKEDFVSRLRVTGYLERGYKQELTGTGFPGSKLEKIGGILANVKPKKKVTIRYYQDEKRSKTAVLTRGLISPAMDHQRIRGELQSPLFETIYLEAFTDSFGRFLFSFNLNVLFDSLIAAGKVKDWNDFAAKANLVSQAFVFNASDAAEAESVKINVVTGA